MIDGVSFQLRMSFPHITPLKNRQNTGALEMVNKQAFEKIDTEEAAYWLGFIAADGNISGTRLRIGLSARDGEHLQKFASWLELENSIHLSVNNGGRPVATLEFSSVYVVKTLALYGIVPRKTYVMTCLPSIPNELMRHFLRGYIDGDGSFQIRAKEGANFGVGAYNKGIIEGVQDWLVREAGVTRTAIICDEGHWRYRQYGSAQVSKIATYLYGNATVYLDRKYALVQRILALDKNAPHDHICENCNRPFQAPPQNDNARFCSNACKSAFRYRSGVDNVTLVCEQCGREFMRNKYLRVRFCSKECSAKAQWAKRKSQLKRGAASFRLRQ